MPPAILAGFIELMQNYNFDAGFLDRYGVLVSGEVYGVVTTLLGFLVVFRNSQAYGRFWEACSTIYQAQGFLADACSSLVAFCSVTDEKQPEVRAFRHTLIRLLSMMSSLMLAELEASGSGNSHKELDIKMPVLDLNGLKAENVENLADLPCKVEVVFQWIQQLCVAQLRAGVIDVPAPIATRAFQELGASVLQFQAAMKIAQVPFPSTYMATMVVLFSVHTCLTPICMAALVEASVWAFMLTFIACFTLWALALLGLELDNPFKHASNRTIDLYSLQTEQNERLVSLVLAAECSVPSVVKGAKGLQKLRQQADEERREVRRESSTVAAMVRRRSGSRDSTSSVDSETEEKAAVNNITKTTYSHGWVALPVTAIPQQGGMTASRSVDKARTSLDSRGRDSRAGQASGAAGTGTGSGSINGAVFTKVSSFPVEDPTESAFSTSFAGLTLRPASAVESGSGGGGPPALGVTSMTTRTGQSEGVGKAWKKAGGKRPPSGGGPGGSALIPTLDGSEELGVDPELQGLAPQSPQAAQGSSPGLAAAVGAQSSKAGAPDSSVTVL